MKYLNCTCVALFCLLALSVQSSAYALSAKPTINGQPWQMVGRGTYSVLLFTAYDIALYTPTGRYEKSKPHALAIEYRMNFTADEIIERSIEEMERSKPLSNADETAYLASLKRVIPNVSEGDIIMAVFTPKVGTTFYKNGKRLGEVKGARFASEYAGIWLATDTNAPSLRESLIKR